MPGSGGDGTGRRADEEVPGGADREEWSAGGVVIRPDPDGVRVLLILDPYGRWGLPKGHFEEGEKPHETALREVREETALEDLILGPEVAEIEWTFRRGGKSIHKHCRFYLMGAPRGEPVPQRDEGITDCRWLSFDDADEVIGYENARGVLRAARDVLGEENPSVPPWSSWGLFQRR